MASTISLVFGVRNIIVIRQVVCLRGQLRKFTTPLEQRSTLGGHPEDTCWKTLLIAIGKLNRQVCFADAAHACHSHSNQTNTYRLLGACRLYEQSFEALELPLARLKHSISLIANVGCGAL